MPCYDARDSWDSDHNNAAAQLLCDLIKRLGDAGTPWTPELSQWWTDHKDRDAYYARRAKR